MHATKLECCKRDMRTVTYHGVNRKSLLAGHVLTIDCCLHHDGKCEVLTLVLHVLIALALRMSVAVYVTVNVRALQPYIITQCHKCDMACENKKLELVKL